jgi:4-amino-4-deoxy-L-arabinose transferase-like glycosyltransferase
MNRWLFLILCLACGLRAALWTQPLHLPANDEIEYITVARDLLAGRGWVFYNQFEWLRAPLYPLFLAGSLWLSGDDLHRAAWPNIGLSVLNVLIAYHLAHALFDRRVALLAALITALLWTHVTFASLYMAETLFTFCFSLGLLVLLRGRDAPVSVWQIIGAGVCFGLAALTRSALLVFLPLVALWLAMRVPGLPWFALRRAVPALLLTITVVLTIAPWTIRNYLAYGRPILVETGLSFNTWYFNEPRETREQITEALFAIANPAERADYATAQGMARLREDPAILVRKLWPNWIYMVRVRPIQDRFLQEDYRGDIDLPLFATALLLDDLLYLLIGVGAVVGFVRSGRGAQWQHALLLSWIAIFLLTALLTHGEARYRHFLFPVLIVYAAAAVCAIRPTASRWGMRGFGVVVALLFSLTWLSHYPWPWAERNLVGGWLTLRGDLAQQAEDYQAAVGWYQQALDVRESPDGYLRLGRAWVALRKPERAEAAYAEAVRRTASYPPAHVMLGDLRRSLGDLDGAREAFEGAPDAPQVIWAWRELRPPPVDTLNVGGGFDYGHLTGVYPAEELSGTTARWSNGHAQLRISTIEARSEQVVNLQLAAPHPNADVVPVTICVATACQTIPVGPDWRMYRVVLPQLSEPDLPVEVRSPTFVAPDGRRLGVKIAEAAVR